LQTKKNYTYAKKEGKSKDEKKQNAEKVRKVVGKKGE
jgi:hypothetical protein